MGLINVERMLISLLMSWVKVGVDFLDRGQEIIVPGKAEDHNSMR